MAKIPKETALLLAKKRTEFRARMVPDKQRIPEKQTNKQAGGTPNPMYKLCLNQWLIPKPFVLEKTITKDKRTGL